MIELDIPKDIRKYEAKLVGPFTTRQLICFSIACVISFGVYTLLGFLPQQDIKYFIILVVDLPVLLCGWWKPYGMPFEKFLAVAFATTVLSPKVRKYVTKNVFFDKYKADKEIEQSKKQRAKKIKASKNKELVAYK